MPLSLSFTLISSETHLYQAYSLNFGLFETRRHWPTSHPKSSISLKLTLPSAANLRHQPISPLLGGCCCFLFLFFIFPAMSCGVVVVVIVWVDWCQWVVGFVNISGWLGWVSWWWVWVLLGGSGRCGLGWFFFLCCELWWWWVWVLPGGTDRCGLGWFFFFFVVSCGGGGCGCVCGYGCGSNGYV